MRTITSNSFTPKLDLSSEILEKYAVNGFGESCTPTLRSHGWTDATAGGILGLTLGSDNLRVLAANLYLLGGIHAGPEDVTKRLATLYWPKVKPTIELRLPLNDLKKFRFDGTLQSDLLDSSLINHEFVDSETKASLSPDQFAEAGGSGFTLKAFCHMKDKLWFSLALVLFPLPKEELLETFPYAADNCFPGLNLLSVDVKLMPNAPDEYGLAFMPLLMKGNREGVFPKGICFAIRDKASSLLQTGRTPRFARDITSLLNKWKKLEGLGDKAQDSLVPPTTPAKAWPSALPSPDQPGGEAEPEGMGSLLYLIYL